MPLLVSVSLIPVECHGQNGAAGTAADEVGDDSPTLKLPLARDAPMAGMASGMIFPRTPQPTAPAIRLMMICFVRTSQRAINLLPLKSGHGFGTHQRRALGVKLSHQALAHRGLPPFPPTGWNGTHNIPHHGLSLSRGGNRRQDDRRPVRRSASDPCARAACPNAAR